MAQAPGRQSGFARISRFIAHWMGQPLAFGTALTVVIVWAVSGWWFAFSDTWQLVINTGTTIVTFLMVFLIQNTQNRDAVAMHLKLDELIRSTQGAWNIALDMEELPEQELNELRDRYQALATQARKRAEHEARSGSPDLESVIDKVKTAAAAEVDVRTIGVLDRAHEAASRDDTEPTSR